MVSTVDNCEYGGRSSRFLLAPISWVGRIDCDGSNDRCSRLVVCIPCFVSTEFARRGVRGGRDVLKCSSRGGHLCCNAVEEVLAEAYDGLNE